MLANSVGWRHDGGNSLISGVRFYRASSSRHNTRKVMSGCEREVVNLISKKL